MARFVVDYNLDSIYKVGSEVKGPIMSVPAPLGEFEQLVLLSIARLGADAYGVTIVEELERQAGRHVSRGALYTTLERLESKGLVRWKVDAGAARERAGLPRRCYIVSARGVTALRASHRILQRMWRGLEGLLEEPTS
jgi:PadR family transcriptional regulator, regulatory protein PadR